jgi:hypothetical protein
MQIQIKEGVNCMRLEIESVMVKDVKVGARKFADHTIFMDLDEIKKNIMSDTRIKSVEINIAYPGERTRIANIVDIIQPRCKLNEDGSDFPGYLGKMVTAGRGKTRSLNGVIVVPSNSSSRVLVEGHKPILDMFGHGAEITRYKDMIAVSIHPFPTENCDELDFQHAVKLAGLKTAVYLAKSAEGLPIDETEIYDLDMVNQPKSDLPRIVFYYQLLNPQYDYMNVPEPILYGAPAASQFPNIIHPNEILDGAVVNPYSNIQMGVGSTYEIQNHGIIKELYRRHGKELLFAGVVTDINTVDAKDRDRRIMMAVNLIYNFFRPDGVITHQLLGGAGRLPPQIVTVKCEELGIKSVHCTGSYEAPLSSSLFANDKSLDAVVTHGNYFEPIRLTKADKILAGSPDTSIGWDTKHKYTLGDEIIVTKSGVVGVYDPLGGTNVIAVDY